MNKIKQFVFLAGLTAAWAVSPGCAFFPWEGPAFGTVSYVDNTLQVTDALSLAQAWRAAEGAVKSLDIQVGKTRQDSLYARMEGLTKQNQPVIIRLTWKSDNLTQIEISVGTVDSPDNRAEAQIVYDRMKGRY